MIYTGHLVIGGVKYKHLNNEKKAQTLISDCSRRRTIGDGKRKFFVIIHRRTKGIGARKSSKIDFLPLVASSSSSSSGKSISKFPLNVLSRFVCGFRLIMVLKGGQLRFILDTVRILSDSLGRRPLRQQGAC